MRTDDIEALADRTDKESRSMALLSHLDTRRLLAEIVPALRELVAERDELKAERDLLSKTLGIGVNDYHELEAERNALAARVEELE